MLSDDEKLAAARRFARATRSGDVDAYAAGAEPDSLVWHSYDETEVAVDRTAKTLRWIHTAAPDVTWTDVAVVATANGFVWQAKINGTAPAGPFSAHTCMVVTLSARGLVARTEEYIDPAALAILRTDVKGTREQ